MSTFQRLAQRALQRPRQPGLGEFETSLDLFPWAALLVDLVDQRILLVNARASELTAFTRAEFLDLELDDLFPHMPAGERFWEPGARSGDWITEVAMRSGGTIEARLQTARLDPADRWALVTLEPNQARRQRQAEQARQEQLWHALHDLIDSSRQANLTSAIKQALQAGQALTGCQVLAAYHSRPDFPGFRRLVALDPQDILPEELDPIDLPTLTSPAVWTPKKHASTSLHRAARAAGLQVLVVLPLGAPEALSGLLAVAGDDPQPPPDLFPLCQIIAAALTTTLQRTIRDSNLGAQLAQAQLELATGKTVLEAANDGVLLISPDLDVLDLNMNAEMILGYSTEEIQGQPVKNILIGTNSLTAALRLAQQGIPTYDLGTVHFHNREGQAFLARVRVLPILSDGRVVRIAILVDDQSEHERDRLRTQQLEHRALLGELTAIFAHEVRNPINNISSGLQLMAHSLPEDDPHQDRIEKLLHDCTRLDHLMKAVLDFSRTNEFKLEPVDLSAMTRRILDRWAPRFRKVGVQARLNIATKADQVLGDQRALEQVLTNLISNAVEAMSKDGGILAINIQSRHSHGERPRLELSVSDTGPGIPEEISDRIFEPFFTTNPQEGTGLGLAITRRIVTAHKGTIEVQSVPGGTVFMIELPAAG